VSFFGTDEDFVRSYVDKRLESRDERFHQLSERVDGWMRDLDKLEDRADDKLKALASALGYELKYVKGHYAASRRAS
jgi:hypothetical protein